MSKIPKYGSALSALALLGAAATVQGATEVYDGNITPAYRVLNDAPAGTVPPPYLLMHSFSVPLFDTMGGTRQLQSVRYELDVFEDGDATLDNPTAAGGFSVSFSSRYRLEAPDNTTMATTILMGDTSGTITLDPADDPDVVPNSWAGFLQASDTFSIDTTTSNGAFLASVTGAGFGTWDFYGGSSTATSVPSGEDVTGDFNSAVDAYLKVTYTWEPVSNEVPEASTWLALLPLVGVGAVAARRRMQARS